MSCCILYLVYTYLQNAAGIVAVGYFHKAVQSITNDLSYCKIIACDSRLLKLRLNFHY